MRKFGIIHQLNPVVVTGGQSRINFLSRDVMALISKS